MTLVLASRPNTEEKKLKLKSAICLTPLASQEEGAQTAHWKGVIIGLADLLPL